MVDYNNRETADRRSKAKPLNLQEEGQAIKLLEDRFRYLESKDDEIFLSTVIANYRNHAKYVAFTDGLWVTEEPQSILDPEKKLFKLGKSEKPKENHAMFLTILEDLNKTQNIEREEFKNLAPVLNRLLSLSPMNSEEEELVQRLLDVYQNMEHYVAYTGGVAGSGGFWFTEDRDKVIDPAEKLFRLTFGSDDSDE